MSRSSTPSVVGASRREMRKAIIRLRMEMHRQEIRQHAREVVNPLSRLRGFGSHVQENLGIKHGPLWGVGLVALLGFFSGKGARSGKLGAVGRFAKLAASLAPLVRLLQRASRR
ncbi:MULTISPECIES: hypothetical protein [unclassified Pseudomonas]|uniref:hypothetical protein n=1 Tax=unclassified Pseudomonas TaxID=196821 RepID=UPI000BC59107|nr:MULTISPECIES: hypothetical protein [unclassified Pseudomonas]PVZ20363.1 hypothetical protein F474_00963 [Pseudomonas sp. URIL14HWK12:I12]PVZ27429.1 hypothetical protein F470_00618 [Pseudomonas sp. URIL14HWK12:I10]PVZ38318.1 hypothetical protein F472_00963 [Pseudomonas sp. URIL14HWK12:I11]SNZ03838.1 hypothetical protein SAMN05660463_00441 [Pseudomonas sp. URIL14HWK12:I9]